MKRLPNQPDCNLRQRRLLEPREWSGDNHRRPDDFPYRSENALAPEQFREGRLGRLGLQKLNRIRNGVGLNLGSACLPMVSG